MEKQQSSRSKPTINPLPLGQLWDQLTRQQIELQDLSRDRIITKDQYKKRYDELVLLQKKIKTMQTFSYQKTQEDLGLTRANLPKIDQCNLEQLQICSYFLDKKISRVQKIKHELKQVQNKLNQAIHKKSICAGVEILFHLTRFHTLVKQLKYRAKKVSNEAKKIHKYACTLARSVAKISSIPFENKKVPEKTLKSYFEYLVKVDVDIQQLNEQKSKESSSLVWQKQWLKLYTQRSGVEVREQLLFQPGDLKR